MKTDLTVDWIKAASMGSHRVMLVLHGLGDSMEGYRWLPQALGIPWMNYLLVNAPDPYYGGYSWYDFGADPAPGIERSRKEIAALLETLPASGFSNEETMLFGFSQGCLMTLETALTYPRKLAGFIGISGYVNDPENLLRRRSAIAGDQKILVTHGYQDPLIPFKEVKQQMQDLGDAGLSLEWHEFDKAHTIDGEAELGVIRDFVLKCFPKPTQP
jgi:phospholipase/carboxylesterase